MYNNPKCIYWHVETSSVSSLCEDAEVSFEQLFLCPEVSKFWSDLTLWLKNLNVKIDSFSDTDKLFGNWNQKDAPNGIFAECSRWPHLFQLYASQILKLSNKTS